MSDRSCLRCAKCLATEVHAVFIDAKGEYYVCSPCYREICDLRDASGLERETTRELIELERDFS